MQNKSVVNMRTLNGLPIVIVPLPDYIRRSWCERLRSQFFHVWNVKQHPCWNAVAQGGFIIVDSIVYMKFEQYAEMIK